MDATENPFNLYKKLGTREVSQGWHIPILGEGTVRPAEEPTEASHHGEMSQKLCTESRCFTPDQRDLNLSDRLPTEAGFVGLSQQFGTELMLE